MIAGIFLRRDLAASLHPAHIPRALRGEGTDELAAARLLRRALRAGVDQANQLHASIDVAYCQPAVGALFNFQLADERRLGGWQSGLLCATWSPKRSLNVVREVVAAIERHDLECD